MGLLDDLAGGALGQLLGGGRGGGGGGMATKLLPVVLGMLASRGGGGSQGGLGGLGDLLGRFQSAGLSSKADSWVGQGENESLDADQVRRAFSDEELDRIANEAGVSRDEAAGGLAELVPGLVDGLTPEGGVPDDDSLMDRIGEIGKMFGR